MAEVLSIRRLATADLTSVIRKALYRLCDSAYGCPAESLFEQLGSGTHLLGFVGRTLVTHLMWVTRWLQPEDMEPLRTAYVEMVATEPASQRGGHASALLRELVSHIRDYDVAALCPATEGLYARQGWRFWRGPLAARRDGALVATPEERVMLLTLPRTPALDWDAGLSIEWRPGEVW